jgi:hypothetical protein
MCVVALEMMRQADIQLTHPIQNVRYYRGRLHHYLPRWTPFRSLLVNRRYEVYICSPSTEQFSTISEFYAAAKTVVIDSTFRFEVSFLLTGKDVADVTGRKESL